MRKTARLLKKWRRDQGYDQLQAARALRTRSVGCTQSQISQIERDLIEPRPPLRERIEKVCA